MLIDTPATLDTTLASLRDATCLAVDTEFMRESTYFPQPCLVQLAGGSTFALVDPIALPDLSALFALLGERARVKILHAARQDLEVLGLVGGQPPPGPVFDTQVAAALLGMPAQIGYADLVSRRLGVSLPKTHTRTDWARRPLSAEQIAYAVDDVRYLAPLHEDLGSALTAAGRLGWLEEEMRGLEDPSLYRPDPPAAWKRLKGLERLAPAQRRAAKLLAQWREHRAIQHDKPRGWILHDDVLRGIAEGLPDSAATLGDIRGIPPGVVRRHADDLLGLVRRARDEAQTEGPAGVTSRPEPDQVSRIRQIQGKLRTLADQLAISPELLATRRDVEQLVLRGDPGILARGWRRDVIGPDLLARCE